MRIGVEDIGSGGAGAWQALVTMQATNIVAAAANEARPAVTSDLKTWSILLNTT